VQENVRTKTGERTNIRCDSITQGKGNPTNGFYVSGHENSILLVGSTATKFSFPIAKCQISSKGSSKIFKTKIR
jgi:hypothetical protein